MRRVNGLFLGADDGDGVEIVAFVAVLVDLNILHSLANVPDSFAGSLLGLRLCVNIGAVLAIKSSCSRLSTFTGSESHDCRTKISPFCVYTLKILLFFRCSIAHLNNFALVVVKLSLM